jgi:fructokinase
MNTEFYTFGEILWDCLPSGRHAGGAPFNVASHIAQLGVSASLLSAVGQDSLGDEILEVAKQKGVNVEFVGRARIGLPTGTVVQPWMPWAMQPTNLFSRRHGTRS